MITHDCADIADLAKCCEDVLGKDATKSFFGYYSAEQALSELVTSLRADLDVYIEYPYVDRVYRDSYYTYFASKLTKYPRNCIRVCLFEKGLEEEKFFTEEGRNWMKNNFLGFFIIRPTHGGGNIGLSCISPNALRDNSVRICRCEIQINVRGVAMSVSGFPSSSQDSETMTCAETSLWALVEYFSHRYENYTTLLPSRIHSTLASATVERQVPSNGLSIPNLSYGLKEFGFATRIYASESFEHNVLMDLIDIYMESGIPLVTGMANNQVGHAFLTIGKARGTDYCSGNLIELHNGKQIYDYPNAKKLVVIDDNHTPYKLLDRINNDAHYVTSNPDWKNCKIDSIVVPLYPKVYLEAFEARKYAISQIKRSQYFSTLDEDLSVRVFLASGRSYKRYILGLDDLDHEIKVVIVDTEMPKLIWIAELYSCNPDGTFPGKDMNVKGLMIVDATEPKMSPNNLILGAWDNTLWFRHEGEVKDFAVPLRPFRPFNNLTAYPVQPTMTPNTSTHGEKAPYELA